jgi:predicted TIM-barrel fold metal-dependent hydrolase
MSDLPGRPRVAEETLLRDRAPRPVLRVPEHHVQAPAFPVVDVHNHVGRWLAPDGSWVADDVDALVAQLDRAGVATLVNLDGRHGAELLDNLGRYDHSHPGRFLTFCHVQWERLADDLPGGDPLASPVVQELRTQLMASATAGARGVKVWKDVGLQIRDASGQLVLPDDPRVVCVLQLAGELGLPVLIHTADPVAFFDPLDRHNERLDELVQMPQWWFGAPGYPTFAALMSALNRLLAACPGTTFIGAHVGGWSEDLAAVGRMLRQHPHWNVDIGGRLGEIGRQPRTFARFVADFPDRVLFGTDAFPPSAPDYFRYYRFLQTDDDHFAYTDSEVPPQGRWAIYGCDLPPALLEAVYHGNATRLLHLG